MHKASKVSGVTCVTCGCGEGGGGGGVNVKETRKCAELFEHVSAHKL